MPAPGRTLPIVQADAPSGEPAPFERLAIIGLGLMGGSLGLAARRAWPGTLVIGVDDNEVLETAMRLHAVDVAADDPVVAAEADMVVLAAPVRASIEILNELPDHVRGEAIVTDVCGSKRALVEAARALPDRLPFIGGHPLAGSTHSGIAFARPDLFAGRPWILTPTAAARPDVLERLERFARGVGASPMRLGAAEHDRLLAHIGHLPQIVASVLTAVIGEAVGGEGLALAGRGLADTTRLAASDGAAWADVFATNRDEVRQALDALLDLLRSVRDGLDTPDTIERLFESASRWRQQMPSEPGTARPSGSAPSS